jgi:hypothetical protein
MDFAVPTTCVLSWDKATQAPAGESFRSMLKSRTDVVSLFIGEYMPPSLLNKIGGGTPNLSQEYLITKVSQVTQVQHSV